MPHGFMAATKMFRVLTAWLERASLKVLYEALHDPVKGPNITSADDRESLEQKFIKERINAITRPELVEGGEDF